MANTIGKEVDIMIIKRILKDAKQNLEVLRGQSPEHDKVVTGLSQDLIRIAELLGQDLSKSEAPPPVASQVDAFYPLSKTIAACPTGLWQIHMVVKLATHRNNARNGNRDAESRLCNRLGQIRRQLTWAQVSENLKEEFQKSVEYLTTVGRVFNLRHEDPRMWISTREKMTRW